MIEVRLSRVRSSNGRVFRNGKGLPPRACITAWWYKYRGAGEYPADCHITWSAIILWYWGHIVFSRECWSFSEVHGFFVSLKGTSKISPFAIWLDLRRQLFLAKIPKYIKYSGISATQFDDESLTQIIKKEFLKDAKREKKGKKTK